MIELTVADYPRFVGHARFELLPREYQQTFRNYVERGIAPGHTLLMVLEGNIRALISFGDTRALIAIVLWCINELPAPLWGNKKRVRQWMALAKEHQAAQPPPLTSMSDDMAERLKHLEWQEWTETAGNVKS